MPNQDQAKQILRTYVTLTTLSTLASSFIWGVNTLFLLDAGLSITEAFAANAFFTAGQVIFEVPTGVVADTWGRRTSYLLGSLTLLFSTILYLLLWQFHSPFWMWAIVSILLGLGFTFFSGAVEAWLVDGLRHTKFTGTLESAFSKGQIATGAAMLIGTLGGGFVAQFTNLGVPYILRCILLGITFIAAFFMMRDIGFKPRRQAGATKEMRAISRSALKYGLGNPPVRYLMLAAPFTFGLGIYAFYAMQPYLLELYGKSDSYAVAGLAAAIVAGAQIIGGMLVPKIHGIFKKRTSVLIIGTSLGAGLLALIGLASSFWVAIGLLIIWALVFAAILPVRSAYMNGLIPSKQRATVLSFDNLLGSSGGIVVQPALGKVAEVSGYGVSYIFGAAVQLLALPFLFLTRKQGTKADLMTRPEKTEAGKEPPAEPLVGTN